MLKQAMYAAPIGALLAAGIFTGTALAAEQEAPPLQTQLCAAADVTALNGILSDLTAADLNGQITDLLAPAGENDPLQLRAGVTIEQARTGLGCNETPAPTTESPAPTETPAPTQTPAPTGPPSPDADPPYETCAEAIDDGAIVPAVRGADAAYQANLDSDSDGIACEAGEGTATPTSPDEDQPGALGGSSGSSGSGTVDSVPSGSVDTGYVA